MITTACPDLSVIELLLGGARSGKSRFAEQRAAAAEAAGRRVIYVATGQAGDDEMATRIAHHRARRPAHWGLAECPIELAGTLRSVAAFDTCLIVDCLTLWLSNVIFAGQAAMQAEAGLSIDCPLFRDQRAALLATLPGLPGHVILVSNEVGWGIVPMAPLSRMFCDEQGRLNQDIAALAHRVTLVAAGLPLELKGSPASG